VNSVATVPGSGAARRVRPPGFVLTLGFGGLLIFLVAAACGTLLVLGKVHGDETRIRKSHLERLGELERIRSQIYLSGTYVRDLLLSPDASGAGAQAARLTALEQETHTALDAYSHALDADDREPFLALQGEIEAYWRVLDRTLGWTTAERDRLRYAFFYEELIPRRTAMLQIADRITQVNERALNKAEERLNAAALNLRNSLLGTFGIALAGGLVLALVTIRSTLRLERELKRRLEENARARADLRELSARLVRAQENERRTLARELHDEVGQSLSAILMEADGAQCAEQPGELGDHLAAIRRLAEKTVNEVRDIALLLRPSMLDDFGLVPALNWHAREMTKRTGIDILVSADASSDDLPDEHKTCIYRIVQEALNNCARHASARHIEIAVRREADRVTLAVRDDGAGFDARYTRGMGILGMEERVLRLGGEFQIDTRPGRGTEVQAQLPLANMPGTATGERNGHEPSHTAG
jgi:signal transduction histidine kinase